MVGQRKLRIGVTIGTVAEAAPLLCLF